MGYSPPLLLPRPLASSDVESSDGGGDDDASVGDDAACDDDDDDRYYSPDRRPFPLVFVSAMTSPRLCSCCGGDRLTTAV